MMVSEKGCLLTDVPTNMLDVSGTFLLVASKLSSLYMKDTCSWLNSFK